MKTINKSIPTSLPVALLVILSGAAAAFWAIPGAAVGQIFVAEYGNGPIGEYATSGATVNAALIRGLKPTGIAVSGGNLFVVDTFNNRICEYNATSGMVVNPALITGLNQPTGIAVSGGNLFVADTGNNRIGEYTTSGATVNAALVTGLNRPTALRYREGTSLS